MRTAKGPNERLHSRKSDVRSGNFYWGFGVDWGNTSMSNKKTGGSAFPASTSTVNYGITMRDYFAAKAMQALISGRSWDHVRAEDLQPMWAKGAYAIADEMIAERAK